MFRLLGDLVRGVWDTFEMEYDFNNLISLSEMDSLLTLRNHAKIGQFIGAKFLSEGINTSWIC